MNKSSTWTALRNPAFRRLWIATVISGTCIAAHDSAATWMMNIFTGSPFLISLLSTLASLPFFLFTLPAGALADKVDRQKLALISLYETMAKDSALLRELKAGVDQGEIMPNIPQMGRFFSALGTALKIATEDRASPEAASREAEAIILEK